MSLKNDSYIKYSFIIPAYNSEKYITRCIESIQDIGISTLEIIVVNDGSVDRTKECVEKLAKHDSRIKLINVKNGGVSNARNVGIKSANGEYILFCDADDFYCKNNFVLVDDLLSKNEIDVLQFGYCINYKIKKTLHKYSVATDVVYTNFKKNRELLMSIVAGDDCLNVWHMAVKKEIIKHIDFENTLKYGEDTLFTLGVMMAADTIYFSNANIYSYNINISSAIGNIGHNALIKKIRDVVESYERQFSLLSANGINLDREFVDKRCFEMIIGDVKKIYYGSKNFHNAEINMTQLIAKLNNNYIINHIKEWKLEQNKYKFIFGHFLFMAKKIIKGTLLT